jgi:hypothetical protein
MHYLALVFDAASPQQHGAAPAPPYRLQSFRLDPEAVELRRDGDRLRSAAIEQSRVPGLSALLWIEARDFNEALRLAADCPLTEHAVLELHALKRSSS